MKILLIVFGVAILVMAVIIIILIKHVYEHDLEIDSIKQDLKRVLKNPK